MATSQPGSSSSAQIADNRIFLFRLQMLIIDGGLTILRNYVDQELKAQSTTLSAYLASEKAKINILKGRKIITQVQYDVLYPSSGTVSTLDLDITLIICLMRNLKCFRFNSQFNWNIPPVQSDTSIEANICRLKFFRNEICHISSTTVIQSNDFKKKWSEIEQILLRIDKVYPIKDFQQTITDFQCCTLDPNTEKRVSDEIEKWNKFDKSLENDLKVMKQTIDAHTLEQDETRKRVSENKEGLTTVNDKIARIEKQLPATDNYQQRKLELRDGLVVYYKKRHSKVFLAPLFQERDTPLASFYVRPELNLIATTQTRNEGKTPVKSLSAMFETENKANQEIYVIANAGFGKTAFSNYLAITWCQAHFPDEDMTQFFDKDDIDCMQGFDFLFLVLLRDSNDLCSIDDLIFEKIVSNLGLQEKLSENSLLKILKIEKCLVILDGLDEWTHPEKKCNRSPRSIPHRNDREKCTVLTTTRPWKLGVLNLNSIELGKKVELTKLSHDSSVTLTEKILQRLKSHPDKHALQKDVTAFISGFQSRQNVDLTSVPLLLIYTICLWCDGVQIGYSTIDFYISIVEFLLSKTIQKHNLQQLCDLSESGIPECFAEYENCKTHFTLLMNLGKMAYYTLFNATRENTLVFDESVARKYLKPDEMEFIFHSGMLSESTSKTLTKKFSKVSFAHKTVQEFFAAIFISFHSDAQTIIPEKCRNIQSILDMSKILEFVSKINSDRMFAISNDLMSVINEDSETLIYRTKTGVEYWENDPPLYNIQKMFMSCLQEMRESENIQCSLHDFFIDKDTMHSKQLQRLLKKNKTNIKSLYIYTSRTSSLPEIVDLFSLTDLSHIQKLYYCGDIETDAEIYLILFPSLQNLTLLDVKFTHDEEILSENFAQVNNLQKLHFENFKLSHKTLDTIFNFISGQKTMEVLVLKSLVCKEHSKHDCERLNLDFSQQNTLANLDLQQLPRLKLNIVTPSLVEVRLLGLNLDESSLLLSLDMLNIKCVVLKIIEIPAESLQIIFTVLENLPQSVTVAICGIKIKPETEYERIINNLSCETFHVIEDNDDDEDWFTFKTMKPSAE